MIWFYEYDFIFKLMFLTSSDSLFTINLKNSFEHLVEPVIAAKAFLVKQ